ncbi:hypothetical protein HELRODRAFT_168124 [Helobdella robusta]|uniref:Wolframin n=1 Tax=Helobdella robusta TaxID=6412 RepID=T1F071_HELRO|nr:hypothetical protein HELRODRAFT_168124 [Helobdella robusta]ESO10237.1 hypothetical protein HELRODRAFT_168124 [Helobdella robusta]
MLWQKTTIYTVIYEIYRISGVVILNATNSADFINYGEAISVVGMLLMMSESPGSVILSVLTLNCLIIKIFLGITNKNGNDVHWCVNTSSWEKKGRNAASKLFKKICMGDKHLTKEEYKRRVAELSENKVERKLLEKAIKENVSEEDFVNRMMKQLHGKSSWSLKLLANDSNPDYSNDSPFYKKVLQRPGQTFTWIIDNIVETAGTQGYIWLKTLMPIQQIYMLVVLFLYNLISFNVVLWITPILGFYVSFFVIIISTMQMFYSRRKLNDVKVLADMLDRFADTFIQESAESAYTWNSLTPYFTLFISLPGLAVTFALADKTWIPCAEITCISLVITVACWFALSDKYDHLAILAILLDNLATLPFILAGMPKIPVIYHILDFFANTGISFSIYSCFEIKIGLPSVAFLIVPFIFANMAMRKSWSGTYQIMIPHLVCFFWWRITVMFFPHTTWISLLRASCGWGILVILSPFIATIGVVYFIISLLKIFSLSGMLKLLTTLFLLASVAMFAYWSKGGFKFWGFSLDNKSAKTNIVLTLILVLSAVPLAYIAVPDDSGKPTNYLPWHIYEKHCGNLKVDNFVTSLTMVNCQSLVQVKVNWTAQVKQSAIKTVENQAESIISMLPAFLSSWLRCTYGDEYPEDCTTLLDELNVDMCHYNKNQSRYCHLTKLNRYTFEVTVLVEKTDQMFKLIMPHTFMEAVKVLEKNDEILFRGFLHDNLGNTVPNIKVYNFKCISCENSFAAIQTGSWSYTELYAKGLRSILNFFFSPLLVFNF